MAYKDLSSKWNFVEIPSNVPTRGGEDSTFDHFRSNPYRFIIREFIQNSIDAASDTTGIKPVKVNILTSYIESEDYPELIGSLRARMVACRDACDKNANGRNPYTKKVEYLDRLTDKPIPYLVIADYNTTGMDYNDGNEQSGFNAGVREMGASHKVTGYAGGSHGLGKTVGFVASQLNAVYYSTKTQDESCYGEGVIRLCTHVLNGKKFYADAFFDSNEGNAPDYAMNIPEVFKRTETGTSVFILGIKPKTADIKTMVQEVLRSFWMSIYHNRLIVTIEDVQINNINLSTLMEEYFNDEKYNSYDIKGSRELVRRFNPKPYFFNCIKNANKEDSFHFTFEAKSSQYPNLEHALLYIYKDESIKNHTEDRIVCMRDKEMVIELKSPGTRKGYYGVLICDGEGSKFLRKMENVTHDKWDKKELKELDENTKSCALEAYKEIDLFIKASIDSIFPITDETEYTIPVLNKYIMASGSKQPANTGASTDSSDDSLNNPQLPISTTIIGKPKRKIVEAKKMGKVVIRPKGGAKKKKQQEKTADGLGLTSQPVAAPVTSNEPTPTPAPTPQPKPMPSPQPNPMDEPSVAPTPNAPSIGTDGKQGDNGGKHKRKKSGTHTEEVIAEFRVIPQCSDFGLVHRIIINSDSNYKSCSMVITIAGEDKDTNLRFKPIDERYKVIGKDMNILSDFDLIKGKNFIDIKFEDNDYHSLKIKAYEY